MPRSRKPPKNSPKHKKSPSSAENPPPVPQKNSRKWSSLGRDVILGLVVCFLFFAFLELILRIAGVPVRDPGDDPLVGFSGTQPLFVVEKGIASTAPAKLRFFNQSSFPVKKGPDTTRVFCFGGSTTYGHPFDGRTAFPRWLEDLLKATNPEKNFEVINTAGISYASYRIVPLVREVLQYSPDLIIISDAHNEFLERRTYSGLLVQGRGLLTFRSFLEDVHTYQALKKILTPLLTTARHQRETDSTPKTRRGASPGPSSGSVQDRGTGKPILQQEVTTILDRSAGLDLYHRDEEFSRGVVQQFVHNLRAMITLCQNARVPVILVEPVSNLKDFSPFKSEHGPDMTATEKAEYRARLDRAKVLLEKNQYEESLNLIERGDRQRSTVCGSLFLQGKNTPWTWTRHRSARQLHQSKGPRCMPAQGHFSH